MRMNRTSTFALLAILAVAAAARAEDEPFVLADAGAPVRTPHFMSLQPVRDNTVIHVNRVDANNAPVEGPAPNTQPGGGLKAIPLRSDRDAVNHGFMRIDRTALRQVSSFHSLSVITPGGAPAGDHADTEGVKVIRPGNVIATIPTTPHAAEKATPTGADATIASLFGTPGEEDEPESFHSALKGEKAPTTSIRHGWPLPAGVEQKVTSGYGFRSDPFNHNASFHGGIDISAAEGTPVLATAEGVVSQVDHTMGFGNFVSVRHRDGTESYYNHLSAQSVRVGQHVMQGQQVGALGSSGRSTGPHLDYRLKKGEETMNPMLALHAPENISTRVAMR